MVVIPEKMNNIEFKEIVGRLEGRGWGRLVQILLEKDSVAYTKNGRLNKSAICRELKMSNKELENALSDLRREFA